jgi:starch-binding outer membrane protein, SusD/RagB family
MRTFWSSSLACLVVLGITGCNDFLSDEEAAGNPNNPTTAPLNALFVGFQAGQFGVQEASLAEVTCEFVQACTGIQRFSQDRGTYGFIDADFNADWAQLYGGGGLNELRQVKTATEAAGDLVYAGIAKVWEAFIIGTAASIWGDIPYREAGPANPAPALDPQLQVYADLQLLLDGAIANLSSGQGAGPTASDLVYAGNAAAWLEAAHTLKARYYLHTAEVDPAGSYPAAIAAASLGISTPTNDFTAYHSAASLEQNLWWQFEILSGFGGDLVAGQFIVDLMVARADPRLAEYFGDADAVTPGAQYVGQSPNGPVPPSVSGLTGTRSTPEFRQPLVTWEENQLILAEANFQVSGPGAALPFVNAVRAANGLAAKGSIATLNEVMEEKYISLYQNIEAFNDYKRTCYPTITPFPTATYNNRVPGRLFYASGEENVNPNVPDVATQLATRESRNANDPLPCP